MTPTLFQPLKIGDATLEKSNLSTHSTLFNVEVSPMFNSGRLDPEYHYN